MPAAISDDPFDWTVQDFRGWANGKGHDRDFWQALAGTQGKVNDANVKTTTAMESCF